MVDNLIAEDLLLLLLDDESGKISNSTFASIETAVGGAILVELSLRGAIEVTEKEFFRQPKVVAADEESSLPPMLADSLGDITEKERTAMALVTRLGKGRKQPLLDRLVDKGMLRCEQDKILGLFPRTRWPAEDSSHEAEIRRKITQALIAGNTVDERTAALISLLSALGLVSNVVKVDALSGREVRKQAKAIADGNWASKAVRDAVIASQAAVTAAISSAAVVSS